MIRLHLVRHGEREAIEGGGGMLGQRDVALSEMGRRQARALAERGKA